MIDNFKADLVICVDATPRAEPLNWNFGGDQAVWVLL